MSMLVVSYKALQVFYLTEISTYTDISWPTAGSREFKPRAEKPEPVAIARTSG
jgi:hypothetical protein